MTTSTEIVPEKKEKSLATRIGWLALICATLSVCYFSHLGAIGFVGPDEPRYAWIARDMAETGDWVTPRLYGNPWFEKPPLYYWGAALSFKLFGVSEAAARLPSAVSALLATLALTWLAWRLYGADTARWLLLLLPTTVGMIGFSHAAATDMPFSAMLTVAMVCAAVIIGIADTETQQGPAHDTPSPQDEGRAGNPWAALLLFGFFLGLAVLAKGPAALVLCGGAVFFWALFTKRWRDAFRLLHPVAIAAFCVTALPWYILCAHRNPDFLRVFILEHNFKRYLTPEFQHIQPWWYYGAILLVALLPWAATLLWTLVARVIRLWKTRHLSSAAGFLLCWSGFVVVFFSLSQSKLPAYVLPAVPGICLVLAHSCAAIAEAQIRSFRLTLLAAAVVFSALFGLIEAITPSVLRSHEGYGVAVGFVIASLAAANLILATLHAPVRTLPICRLMPAFCVLPILLLLSFGGKLLPSFFQWDPSGRSLARALQVRGIPSDELSVLNMRRGQHYSLNFYLRREVRDWDSETPTAGYLLKGGVRTCKYLVPPTLDCEEIPFDLESTGEFLYRVKSVKSAAGPAGGKSQ